MIKIIFLLQKINLFLSLNKINFILLIKKCIYTIKFILTVRVDHQLVSNRKPSSKENYWLRKLHSSMTTQEFGLLHWRVQLVAGWTGRLKQVKDIKMLDFLHTTLTNVRLELKWMIRKKIY